MRQLLSRSRTWRHVLTTGLAVAVLVGGCPAPDEMSDGADGSDGVSGVDGSDGSVGAQGAAGAPGAQGPVGAPGLACWDANGDGVADAAEDVNGDGAFDALDCQGAITVGSGLALAGDMVSLDTDFADARYWKLGGNAQSATQVLGTLAEAAIELIVNGTRALRIEPTTGTPNFIAGAASNSAGAAQGAAIGGGGDAAVSTPNFVHDNFGTVAGGVGNVAGLDDADPLLQGNATVGGGSANTASGFAAAVGGGSLNTASGEASTIAGGSENMATSLHTTVSGGVGNHATVTYAVVGGGFANQAAWTAATVGGGTVNQASDAYTTVAGGTLGAATGTGATIGGGYQNTASGSYSTIPGGRYAEASNYGQMAYSANQFAANGDAQMSFIVLSAATTDDTPTVLTPGGVPGAAWTLAPESSVMFDIHIVGRSESGTHGAFQIIGSAELQAGAITLAGVTTTTIDPLAGGVSLTFDNTTQSLQVLVTGFAATPIRWVASVRMVEVRYP